MLEDSTVKTELLTEAHSSPFSMYPDSTKVFNVPASEGIKTEANARFTSKFWKGFQIAWDTRLDFSTTFHPQTDRYIECLNQILEDMLRACVLEFSGTWDFHLHFTYNNSYQATIGMAPFKALYGKCYRSPICWGEVAPMKGVLRIEKKGKFIMYSMSRKYIVDPMHIVDFDPLQINENLSYEAKQPIEIVAREVKMLKNREIAMVKVLW
ncbi:pol protein [Cucumis melo var. makuwa]|uniref:Pol protein n=1 Tax=Cucumis melo var. makuwa TaxID=1194695 RepID=A0A5A7VCR7_CUCMM|nr:pol protein [Cucumis melo var. makuwa]TYK02863.1 pol protein [Cucumis melo var. makuwa]